MLIGQRDLQWKWWTVGYLLSLGGLAMLSWLFTAHETLEVVHGRYRPAVVDWRIACDQSHLANQSSTRAFQSLALGAVRL